ncbi:MAG: AAA family ATPase [Gemmatimonadales bacterium]|nr:AAA family ATPase [Gemmatimonadales bacterium]
MTTPYLILASEVPPIDVSWLWDGWLPVGKLVFLEGDPGCGKTTIALDLVARITSGVEMPSGGRHGPGGALVISAEDDAADTLRPRLDAAGADCGQVHFLHPESPMPALPSNSDWLAAEIVRTSSRLVVLDTTMAFLGAGIDSYRDQDVRRALNPIVQTARETGATVLAIRHFRKSSSSSAINRGIGSVAFAGLARTVLSVAAHPDGKSMVLAQSKCNLAPKLRSRRFTIEGAEGAACISWGEECDLSADDLATMVPVSKGAVEAAKEWLEETLGTGAIAATEVKVLAEKADIKQSTLRRAREALGITTSRSNDRSFWSLPPQLVQLAQLAHV